MDGRLLVEFRERTWEMYVESLEGNAGGCLWHKQEIIVTKRIYVPTQSYQDWKRLLAQPDLH
jgi:hypothetical protein